MKNIKAYFELVLSERGAKREKSESGSVSSQRNLGRERLEA